MGSQAGAWEPDPVETPFLDRLILQIPKKISHNPIESLWTESLNFAKRHSDEYMGEFCALIFINQTWKNTVLHWETRTSLPRLELSDMKHPRQRSAIKTLVGCLIFGGILGLFSASTACVGQDRTAPASTPAAPYPPATSTAPSPYSPSPPYAASAASASPAPYPSLSQTAPQAPAPESLQPIRVQDVIDMNRAGLDEGVMADQIRRQGFSGTLTVDDLILLSRENVPTSVVRELQLAAPGARAAASRAEASISEPVSRTVSRRTTTVTRAPTVIYETPPPIVVRSHYYSYPSPAWHCPPYGYHPPVRIVHPSPALQFHFRF